MMFIFSFILAINYVSAEEVMSPTCNFASDDYHVYPIDACTKEKSGSIYSAFKYVCYGNNQVYNLTYNTPQYCDGPIVSSIRVTDELSGYKCDSTLCSHAETCAITGCATNGNCTECATNPNNYDLHCLPWVTGHCTGLINQLLIKDECINGINTQSYYSVVDNCDGPDVFNIPTEDNSCIDDTYYTVECNSELLLPQCNYVATDFKYYPINACHTKRNINNEIISYSAFKYVCIGENVYKYEYNTNEYCDGSIIASIKQNEILEHFECDLNDCKYANKCVLEGCDYNCNECELNGNNFNEECSPVIYNECYGHKSEVLRNIVCQRRPGPMNDLLIDNVYWGNQCIDDGETFLIYSEEFGGNNNCTNNQLTSVDCHPLSPGYGIGKGKGNGYGREYEASNQNY
eukprot:375125_1